ncbi:ATP-binding protein [Peribacillus sp. FSL H8-0477]|uniref:ATP-binding protein n=1 Tax=Peribacillus sp. FSL H8-0477 TaxID=2921388 RepID=UPI0030F7EDB1
MKDMSIEDEIESLKIENQRYRELVSELPFPLTYHSRHGMIVKKASGKDVSYIEGKNNSMHSSFIYDCFSIMEGYMTNLFDHVPHHIVFIDKDGLVTLCNEQTALDLHVDQKEIVGTHIRDLLKLPDEEIFLLKTLNTKEDTINHLIMDKNYGVINTRIIYEKDGSIKRVIGIFQFVNLYKGAAKQALAGGIAAGIAHELRNPFTTVRGFLQLMQESIDKESAELFRTLLIPEIDRANTIISDFLKISRSAHMNREKIEFDFFVNNHLLKILTNESFLYHATVNHTVSKEASECIIEMNKDEIIQVFINLFRNAVEAVEQTNLRINWSADRVEDWLAITFRDNGSGIDPAILSEVFDPFFTTKSDGTGLGLSISKTIIDNHGGRMEVASSQLGTIFTIMLPVSKLS